MCSRSTRRMLYLSLATIALKRLREEVAALALAQRQRSQARVQAHVRDEPELKARVMGEPELKAHVRGKPELKAHVRGEPELKACPNQTVEGGVATRDRPRKRKRLRGREESGGGGEAAEKSKAAGVVSGGGEGEGERRGGKGVRKPKVRAVRPAGLSKRWQPSHPSHLTPSHLHNHPHPSLLPQPLKVLSSTLDLKTKWVWPKAVLEAWLRRGGALGVVMWVEPPSAPEKCPPGVAESAGLCLELFGASSSEDDEMGGVSFENALTAP